MRSDNNNRMSVNRSRGLRTIGGSPRAASASGKPVPRPVSGGPKTKEAFKQLRTLSSTQKCHVSDSKLPTLDTRRVSFS